MAPASVDVDINGRLANATLRELRKEAKQLRNELANLSPASNEFAEKSKKLQNVDNAIGNLNNKLKASKGLFNGLSNELKAFGVIAAASMAFQFLTSKISEVISQNAKLSDSFADIRKTTGMTASEVQKLNAELSQMDTRTSTADLRQMAAVAGQLGIAKKDVLGFVDSMDKLNVALGDEFGGNAEDLTAKIGGLRNVLVDNKTEDIAGDLLRLGNALNTLGAEGAATSPVIQDFANRIGGIAIPMGLSSGQVLGLSATLQELNITAERGGTAIVKLLQKMTSNIDEFAKIAGVSSAEFAKTLDTDLFGALMQVSAGSTKSAKSATQLTAMLQDAELSGAGVTEIFSKLGANTELLSKRADTATQALKGTGSVMDEFALKNNNFAAKLEKVQKFIMGAFTNPAVTEWMEGIVDVLDRWISTPLSEKLEEEQIQLLVLEARITDTNVKQEERIALINELKEKYPDYLKNINAETVSNADLSNSLAKINENLVNKIVLQKKSEEVEEKAKEAADFRKKQLEFEAELLKSLAKASQKYNVEIPKTGTLLQKSLSVQQQLSKIAKEGKLEFSFETAGGLNRDINNLQNWMNTAKDKFNQANASLSVSIQERKQMMASLGMSEEDLKPTKTFQAPAEKQKRDISGGYESDKAAEAAKKAEEKRRKAEEKERAKTEKSIEKHLEIIRKIEDKAVDDYNNSIQDKYAKARAIAGTNAQREMEEAEKLLTTEDGKIVSAQILEQTRTRAMDKYKAQIAEINEEEAKANKERELEQNKLLALKMRSEAQEKVAIAERQLLHAQTAEEAIEAERQIYFAKKELLAAEHAERLLAKELSDEEYLAMEEEFLLAMDILDADYKAKRKNARKQEIEQTVQEAQKLAQDVLQLFNIVADISFNFAQARFNNEMQNIERLKNAELFHLKNSLDAKTITEEEFNKRKQEIDRKYALQAYQAEVKLFKKKQELARAEAFLKAAILGLELSIKFSPIVGIPLAGATLFSQLALIDSQQAPAPPQFAKGGATMPFGSIKTGGSIASGGFVSSPYLATVGERGAEYIIPNNMLQMPEIADTVNVLESIRTGKRSSISPNSGELNLNADGGNSAVLMMLNKMCEKLDNMPKYTKTILSYQELGKFLDDGLEARYPSGIPANNTVKPRIFGTK